MVAMEIKNNLSAKKRPSIENSPNDLTAKIAGSGDEPTEFFSSRFNPKNEPGLRTGSEQEGSIKEILMTRQRYIFLIVLAIILLVGILMIVFDPFQIGRIIHQPLSPFPENGHIEQNGQILILTTPAK
jgi:hypothetical protein